MATHDNSADGIFEGRRGGTGSKVAGSIAAGGQGRGYIAAGLPVVAATHAHATHSIESRARRPGPV